MTGVQTCALPIYDPRAAVPARVKRMIAAGHLGRKTGQGFFKYSGNAMFGG